MEVKIEISINAVDRQRALLILAEMMNRIENGNNELEGNWSDANGRMKVTKTSCYVCYGRKWCGDVDGYPCPRCAKR